MRGEVGGREVVWVNGWIPSTGGYGIYRSNQVVNATVAYVGENPLSSVLDRCTMGFVLNLQAT